MHNHLTYERRFRITCVAAAILAISALAGAQTLPLTLPWVEVQPVASTQTYSFSFTGQGGTPPYQWSASGLPAGLTLSSTGTLAGSTTVSPGVYPLQVTLADAAGASVNSTVPLYVNPAPVLAVNAGGSATGRFGVDAYNGQIEGGAAGTPVSTTAVIDNAGIFNTGPADLYRSARTDARVVYTLAGLNAQGQPNLTPGASYLVRLHFADFQNTVAGQRRFNVTLAGTQVLTDFDIIAAAGRPNRAIIKQFIVTAGARGIQATFTQGSAGLPLINDIEVLPAGVFTSATPASPDANDQRSYELGMPFRATVAGLIRSIRYYKGSTETGTHTGRIWDAQGQQVATAVFTNETASGWQEAILATPLPVSAGVTYTVTVNANTTFAISNNALAQPAGNGYIRSAGPGLFGDLGTLPTQSFQASNYFRDVSFEPTESIDQALLTTQTIAMPDANDGRSYELGIQVNVAQTGQATAIRYWKPATETGSHVGHLWDANGGLLATVNFTGESASGWQQANLSAPVTLVANQTYVVSVNANTTFADTHSGLAAPGIQRGDLSSAATVNNGVYGDSGTFPTASFQSSNYFRDLVFRTGAAAAPAAPPQTIFTNQTIGFDNASDGRSYELGTLFQAAKVGQIRAIRFYKASNETGTHTGRLWDASGTQLASVTFTNETASGWQEAALASPITIAANQTYTVSVNANAYFVGTYGALTQPITNGDLQVPANGGVYGDIGLLPTQTYQSTNYFRDVVFVAGGTITPPAPDPWVHRGYLGWIRDLASEGRPNDAWPSIVIDNQLISDYAQAAATLARDGLNEFQIWGFSSTFGYDVNVEQSADPTRVAQVKQIIASVRSQGIKVMAGTGIMSWGFNNIIAANPSIACTNSDRVANPTVELAWDYQKRIIDYLFSFGIDGITLQPADLGRCECGPACTALGNDAAYYAYLIDRTAQYVRSKYPTALIGIGGYGINLSNPADLNSFKLLASHIDYFNDVGNTLLAGGSAYRRQAIAAVKPTLVGSIAPPGVSPPQHWSRTRWFLPTFQHQIANLRALYADGGRASENFMRTLANPSDEVSTRMVAAYEKDPTADTTQRLDAILAEIYGPLNATAAQSLRDLFIQAENAYFNNASVNTNEDIALEPLVNNSEGPPIYLSNAMSSSGRAAYRAQLNALISQAQGLLSQVSNSARLQTVITCMQNVLVDLNTLP